MSRWPMLRRAAVISNVAAGLALAAVGVVYVVLNGGRWLNWVGAALGVWILIAPQVLGAPRFAGLEASWGGPLALALVVIAALDWSWYHAAPPAADRPA